MFIVTLDNSFAAESNFDLNYDLSPQKIHEGDILTLEIYRTIKDQIVFEKIENIRVESLDSSIIEVQDFVETHEFKNRITLKAINEGSTFLYAFADGNHPLEIPITIYANNSPSNLSLDIFPNSVNNDNNSHVVLTLTLTNNNGIVTLAENDFFVKLSASKSDVIPIDNSNLIISKEEFSSNKIFTNLNPGIVTITAKSGDLESFELLTVNERPEQTIEVSVFPKTLSSSNTANGHIIAQLFSDGELVKASKDITIFYEIPLESEDVNSSTDINSLNPSGYFHIKEGFSYGHEIFSIQKGITDSHTITVTSQDPLVVVEESFETLDVEVYGDEEVKFESVDVLADGSRQLVGVIFLEDVNGHPVTSDRDIVVPFTSSDDLVSIETTTIHQGYSSALVFGTIGNFVPSTTDIKPQILNSELTSLTIHGFSEDSISLEIHSVTDTIPKEKTHWIISYLESSDGELFKIPDNQKIQISDSAIFEIEEDLIQQYPYFILIPVTAVGEGEDELQFSLDNFETSMSLTSAITEPSSLQLDFSEKLYNGISDIFTIQVLDGSGLPVSAETDIEVKIFSSQSSVIDFEKNVKIPKNTSFTSFEIIPLSSGTTEISLVSEGLPVVTEEITIGDLTPTIQITSADLIDEGESFLVSILAKQNNAPLRNALVTWEFDGGITTIADEKTGPTGEAVASIIPTSNESVKIHATINNGPIQSAYASKIVKVNATMPVLSDEELDDSFKKPDLGGIDPVLILVPALIGGMIFYMKKNKK